MLSLPKRSTLLRSCNRQYDIASIQNVSYQTAVSISMRNRHVCPSLLPSNQTKRLFHGKECSYSSPLFWILVTATLPLQLSSSFCTLTSSDHQFFTNSATFPTTLLVPDFILLFYVSANFFCRGHAAFIVLCSPAQFLPKHQDPGSMWICPSHKSHYLLPHFVTRYLVRSLLDYQC